MVTSPASATTLRWTRRTLMIVGGTVLMLWTAFPILWILLTSLKQPVDVIAAPPKFLFSPTTENYRALFIGQQRGLYMSSRPDFPRFFLNSVVICSGAVALSFAVAIPASYALARYRFRFREQFAFLFMGFRFVPFITFLIPLYVLFQQLRLYNTYTGLILAYQLITLPFTIWMLRSFFMEVPTEVEEAAKIDGCSWWGILRRIILPLSLPGMAVTLILGFMFSWNAFNYPLRLAGRQTFPVTVGAIQFISYEQVLWGQMAAASIVAIVPQLLLSLAVQKYIVRGLTMGAVR